MSTRFSGPRRRAEPRLFNAFFRNASGNSPARRHESSMLSMRHGASPTHRRYGGATSGTSLTGGPWRWLRQALAAAGSTLDWYFSRRTPFRWSERDHSDSWWSTRLGAFSVFAVALVGLVLSGALAVGIASRVATSASDVTIPTIAVPTAASQSGPILLHIPGQASPTPVVPAYLVGVWPSTYSPHVGGNINVYARITAQGSPAAHVPVMLSVQYSSGSATFGPVVTDADGLAIFRIPVFGAVGQPIVLTASVQAGKTSFTGLTTIVGA